jgi:hypothetical protein
MAEPPSCAKSHYPIYLNQAGVVATGKGKFWSKYYQVRKTCLTGTTYQG